MPHPMIVWSEFTHPNTVGGGLFPLAQARVELAPCSHELSALDLSGCGKFVVELLGFVGLLLFEQCDRQPIHRGQRGRMAWPQPGLREFQRLLPQWTSLLELAGSLVSLRKVGYEGQ